jgi:hypothetical protein
MVAGKLGLVQEEMLLITVLTATVADLVQQIQVAAVEQVAVAA